MYSGVEISACRRWWGHVKVLATALAIPCAAVVSGCRAPAPERSPIAAAAAAAAAHAGAEQFRLDTGATQIWFYVHADGPLARLGHSHVISTQALRGSVWLHPQLDRSSCEFELAVSALVVDDPHERALAGGEFATPLDDEARAGTREHLLGEQQLDAARSPLLLMRCRSVSATPDGAVLDLTVTLRGHDAQLSVPVRWQRSAKLLQGSGEFDFKQTTLGLEPYSALFGALRVADDIHARFRMVALMNR